MRITMIHRILSLIAVSSPLGTSTVFAAPQSNQTSASQAPTSQGAASYTTSDTNIGVLLDDPAAKAVLAKHIPDVVNNEQVSRARAMTLKQIQQYVPETLPDEVLAQIDADLSKLPAKKQ